MSTSFWDRLTTRFAESDKNLGSIPEQDTLTRPEWLDKSKTIFAVPVLDLTESVLAIQSHCRDPEMRKRVENWGSFSIDDLEFDDIANEEIIDCELTYPTDSSLQDGLLSIPTGFDDKWVFALKESKILIIHSWTGIVEAIADCSIMKEQLTVERIHFNPELFKDLFSEDLASGFDWFFRSHVLEQALPLNVGLVQSQIFERDPVYAFSLFGSNLIAVTSEAYEYPQCQSTIRSRSPLVTALLNEDWASLEACKNIAEIEVNDPMKGFNLGHFAVFSQSTETILRLHKLGVNFNIASSNGLRPIELAIMLEFEFEVIKLLIQSKIVDTSIIPPDRPLLCLAARGGFVEVVKLLLEHGADINARTAQGLTAAHLASASGQVEVLKALLEHGFDREMSSPFGTILELAKMNEIYEVEAFLSGDA